MYSPAVIKQAHERKKELEGRSDYDFSDPVKWIEKHFYIGRDRPFIFHPTQAGPLREALRRNADGSYRYQTVVWSWPKKSAKTTIASAVTLYKALATDDANLYLVGNKLQQADSRVGGYIQDSLKFNHLPGISSKRNTITLSNGSVIRSIPVNPAGEAGSDPNFISYTELWGYTDNLEKHKKMWSEMTLSPNRNGQRWIDTYAGFQGESIILENLYEQGLKGERLDPAEVGGNEFCYRRDDIGLFMVWVENKHYLPWQQNERYYANERATLLPSEFDRMHLNIWGSSLQQFIDAESWDACEGDLKQPGKNWVVLAADAGVNDDTFSLVGVWVEHRAGVRYFHPFYKRRWIPPAGGEVNFSVVQAEIERLCRMYSVVEFTYDPYQMVQMAQDLRFKNIVATEKYSQGVDRLTGDTAFRSLIKGGRIVHDGDKVLRSHVLNANAKLTGDEENRMRMVKRNDKQKIDMAVALSMACHRANVRGL